MKFLKIISKSLAFLAKKGKAALKSTYNKALHKADDMVENTPQGLGNTTNSIMGKIGGVLAKIGAALATLIVNLLPILIISLVAISLVGWIANFVTNSEDQNKFTNGNYQEDSSVADNQVKVDKDGNFVLNGKSTHGNQLYYMYYALNMTRSYTYVLVDNDNNPLKPNGTGVNKDRVTLTDENGKTPDTKQHGRVLPISRGDTQDASEIESLYSSENNSSSLKSYATHLSMSTELLYLLDTNLNRKESGVSSDGFFFPEQFTKPVNHDKHWNFKPLDSMRKVNSDDKRKLKLQEAEYQKWLQNKATSLEKGSETNGSSKSPTPSSQSGSAKKLVDDAKKYLNIPYVWGGHDKSNPKAGLDCSGLVSQIYYDFGIKIPAYTVAMEKNFKEIDKSEIKAGDVLFWGSHGSTYHIAMAINNKQMIEEPRPGLSCHILNISAEPGSWAARNDEMSKIVGGGDYGSNDSATGSSEGWITHTYKYDPKSIDTGNFIATSYDFDRSYDPKKIKSSYDSSKKVVVDQNSPHPHAHKFNSKGQNVEVPGTWSYGFGTIIKIQNLKYEKFDFKNKVKPSWTKDKNGKKIKIPGSPAKYKHKSWAYKLVLSGVSTPVGSIDLSKEIKEQLEQSNANIKAGTKGIQSLPDADDEPSNGYDTVKTTLPNLTNNFSENDVDAYGISYIMAYLQNYSTYIPDYVSHSMNVEDRWNKLHSGKAASKWKDLLKVVEEESSMEHSANQTNTTTDAGDPAELQQGSKHGGISFVGKSNGAIQNTMKYWKTIQKYAKEYGMDPYFMVAEAAEESGGTPSIHQQGGPAWGFYQFEFGSSYAYQGNSKKRKVEGYDASGKKASIVLEEDKSSTEDQIKAGAIFMSSGRELYEGNNGNVASNVIHHHLPAVAVQVAKKGSTYTLSKAVNGQDGNYVKRWLSYYGGKTPWVMDLHGKKHYDDGKVVNGTGEEISANGSGSDTSAWDTLVSSAKGVLQDIYGTSSFVNNGVDIWSDRKVPQFENQPDNNPKWVSASDLYAWEPYTNNLSSSNASEVSKLWMLSLMDSHGSNAHYDDLPADDYSVGRWLDDYYVTQFMNAQKDATQSNNDDSDGDMPGGDWGWPTKGKSKDISSPFGARNLAGSPWHDGIDVSNNKALYAIHGGKVIFCGNPGTKGLPTTLPFGLGKLVIVTKASDGYEVVYQEFASSESAAKVKTGDTVKTGQQIGTIQYGVGGVNHVHVSVTNKKDWVQAQAHWQNPQNTSWFLDPEKVIKSGNKK